MAVAVGDQRRKKEAQELLVQEIAKGEVENIPVSLRTAIERGWLLSFPTFLLEAKKKKDTEIERICSRHYTDFLNSVNEMLKMQGSAQELKTLVFEINAKFNSTGGDLLQVLNDLNRIQEEREITKKLLEASHACKEVAQLMVEVKEQTEHDRHYQAMRTIELIQHELTNPNIKPMLKPLQSWLPIAINKLLYAARTDADNFLSSLREKSSVIGNTLLIRQAKTFLQTFGDISAGVGGVEGDGFGMRRMSSWSRALNTVDNNGNNPRNHNISIATRFILSYITTFRLATCTPTFSIEDFIPFHFQFNKTANTVTSEANEFVDHRLGEIAPLHKALHLYAILGNIQNFAEHFRHLRTDFFAKLLKTFERTVNQIGLLKAVPRYFEDLVGFFMIECVIGKMIEIPSALFTVQEIDKLFEESMIVLKQMCDSMAITLASPHDLIQIKEEFLLLLHTLADEVFHFDILPLIEVMWSLFDVFDALSVQHLTLTVRQTLDKAAYQPYFVSNNDTYQAWIKPFRLDTVEVNREAAVTKQGGVHAYHTKDEKNDNYHHLDRLDLEASMDALEEEMAFHGLGTVSHNQPTSSSNNSGDNNNNNNNNKNVNKNDSSSFSPFRSSATNNHDMKPTGSNFMAQTYPFSEFVPIIMKELQLAIVRHFLFVMVPAPERWNRQIVQQQQSQQRRVTDNNTTANHNSNSSVMTTPQPASSLTPQPGTNHSPIAASGNNGRQQQQQQPQTATNNVILSSASIASGHISIAEYVSNGLVNSYALIADHLQTELIKDGIDTALSKACQIAIDSSVLALTLEHIFEIAAEAIETLFGPEHLDLPPLNNAQDAVLLKLRKLTSQAQDLMFELLANKIDELLQSLVFINLCPETLPNVNNQVHESIESIVAFLQTTFMWLTHLPQSVREAVHFTSCSKAAQGLLSFILSDRVSKINVFCLVCLDMDCKKLEAFADGCGVPSLRQCFEEVHALIKAVLHPDLARLGDEANFRRQLFPTLNPVKLATLLEKVQPSPMVAASNNLPRLEKNLTKAVAKKLRGQHSQR